MSPNLPFLYGDRIVTSLVDTRRETRRRSQTRPENVHLSLLLCVLVLCSVWTSQAQRAEEYVPLANDGAWCWFSDPRALYHKGRAERMYAGWVSAKGDVTVGSYDYQTGETQSTTVWSELQKDDHINPSLLVLPDGRIMVFFTKHNGPFYWTASLHPEDISAFHPVRTIDMGKMLCYTNPVMLSQERNRIYVFFRGGYDWKPSFVYSDDLGSTWSAPKTMVAKPGAPASNRPYTKVSSDGKATIHFAFTDGHPRNEPANSIYYLRYYHGTFYDAAGKQVGDTSTLPLNQDAVPKVYDGGGVGGRAWIWDVATDGKGNPVLVYSTLPEESFHSYNYAFWDGSRWQNRVLCEAGSWFPRFNKKKEEREPEPHYSGGVYLDHENTNRVFLSRPHDDVFEIESWETTDRGITWSQRLITSHSDRDNVRPYVVRNAPAEKSPRLLWMRDTRYRHYTDYRSAILTDRRAPSMSGELRRADVMYVTRLVADWQIGDFDKVAHHELDWTCGALYTGMVAFAQLVKEDKYLDWLTRIGQKYHWQPSFRMYHADDICVSQMYIELSRMKNDQRMVVPTKARIDWVLQNPSPSSLMLDYADPSTLDRWSWCDALFMAPPVYAKLAAMTGDEKYLKFMNNEFRATYDFLYDKQEHLFFRDHRYFQQREANGKKVFWGRGNGWVLAGLANLLKELPATNREREFYRALFTEMAETIRSLQDTVGYWHASLLDPASYPNPETSATGFFCYGLAYGVNEGILDRSEYLPAIKRAWGALVRSVYPDGKLGWVQPIGADPKKVERHMTEVYGVGAFLLAGSEVYKLVE